MNPDLSAPLTHEEFVLLRDCAKGLMHRTIPAEHKDRLIQLGPTTRGREFPARRDSLANHHPAVALPPRRAKAAREALASSGPGEVRESPEADSTFKRISRLCAECAQAGF